MSNQEFSAMLRRAADALELRKVQWKPNAYRKAADAIDDLKEDLKKIHETKGRKGLEGIPGVGPSIAMHIIEYLETGKVKKWKTLEKEVPEKTTELMRIRGLGPSKVRVLSERLRIKDIKGLKKALRKKKIRKVAGFGKKSEEEIGKAVGMFESGEKRMLIGIALPAAENIVEHLKKNSKIRKIDYAGSLRRMKETIGDIDILATSRDPVSVIKAFTGMPEVLRVLAKGPTKSTVLVKNGPQIDLRVVPKESYGAALMYFTGSKEHNVTLRTIAIGKGYKLSEYGLFRKNKRVPAGSEKEIYRKLGMAFIPPEMREARGEIEAAAKGKMPKLIEQKDIRGDLQMHTTYSDGAASVAEMAKAAKALGYEYIAITDHSPATTIAQGPGPDELRKQWKEIDKVSKRYGIKVLKGAEVEILADGTLDYPEEILKKLDITLCAAHTGFKAPRKKVMERFLAALENEYLDILAHPTGRKINEREGFDIDFDRLFQTAADNKKVLEIDSQPQRLDLHDSIIMRAKGYGIKFAIDTDAHSPGQLGLMRYGIGQARRGWLARNDIVNTLPLSKLKKIFRRIRD